MQIGSEISPINFGVRFRGEECFTSANDPLLTLARSIPGGLDLTVSRNLTGRKAIRKALFHYLAPIFADKHDLGTPGSWDETSVMLFMIAYPGVL
jgi:hypothetical protein